MYSVWPPVSLRVRVSLGIGLGFWVSLGFRIRVRVKVRVSFFDSPLSCVLYSLLCPLGLGLV